MMNIGPYKTHLVACPACGYEADYGTCFNGEGTARPVQPNDISMCVGCATYLVYTDDLKLRLLSDGEWLRMPRRQQMYLTYVRGLMMDVKANGVPCTRCKEVVVPKVGPPLCLDCMKVVHASGGSEHDDKWRRE